MVQAGRGMADLCPALAAEQALAAIEPRADWVGEGLTPCRVAGVHDGAGHPTSLSLCAHLRAAQHTVSCLAGQPSMPCPDPTRVAHSMVAILDNLCLVAGKPGCRSLHSAVPMLRAGT